ncbi:hypothetical protein TA3x_000484 [Tundrisphaera sp. TA3]|uniref:hypothetical protein n=1 Tax=Tundrisphaera sp. TA3 TaxID=3435775 RepID=UPI003EC00959
MEQTDLSNIIYRLDQVERMQNAHTAQNVEIRVELGSVKTELGGVREQAKAHSEASTKAIAELKQQFTDTLVTTQTLIANTGRELQLSIDKIISALDLDKDANAGRSLRSNLDFLSSLRAGHQDTITWTKRGLITLILTGVGTIIIIGAKKALTQ